MQTPLASSREVHVPIYGQGDRIYVELLNDRPIPCKFSTCEWTVYCLAERVSKLKWAEVTPEFVYEVATHLREVGSEEVMLSDHISGYDACAQSWAMSDLCNGIATDDGTPVGLCGLNGDRIWLLATPELTATKKDVCSCAEKGEDGWNTA